MKYIQRVYIKGNFDRGDEVIKVLTDLGGKNSYRYDGKDDNIYYYIAPNGVIKMVASTYEIFSFVKEFYKEIELPKWKPESDNCYYYVDIMGNIVKNIWNNNRIDNGCYRFGNCFITLEKAEAARDNIKKCLTTNN